MKKQSIIFPGAIGDYYVSFRAGLGAENLPRTKQQSERAQLQLKIKKKILKAKRRKKENFQEEQEAAATATGGSHDDQCSDNETSKANSISSKKRHLTETVDTRPFKRRRSKRSRAKKRISRTT